MVAHAGFYNNGAMVRPQVGDQLTRNSTLLNIFDPGEMLVRVSVAEPDGALLRPNLSARVYIDAYPDMTLPASFVAASPIAASPALRSGGVMSSRCGAGPPMRMLPADRMRRRNRSHASSSN